MESKVFDGGEKAPAASDHYGATEIGRGEIVTDDTVGSTKRGLKSRHAQMIALGGTIGTGLFVGSGQTLALGGPAFLLTGYVTMSLFIFCIVTAITEVATYLPLSGGTMSYYGSRNVSKSLGFAMGWLYFYSLGILVPYEITAASIVIDYWNSPVNIAVWITILIIVILGLNLLPVQVYGETEFWFASIKVFTMIGLLILSFVLFWGGGPRQDGILGFHYWKDPGATNTWLVGGSAGTFVAFLGALVSSAFPFTFAPELIVVTAGEMQMARRNLPKAANRYFFRLIFFYIFSAIALGVICPSNNAALTSGGVGAKSSPFVVGINNAGISGLGSVINAAILTSAWSSGNSFFYMSSRSLYSLAVAGDAPAFFRKCSKRGIPYYAVAATACFMPLAYMNCAKNSSVVFTWFINITNTSGFISWICCCIVYLRFRKACRAQGVGKQDLPYHSFSQPVGSYGALVFFVILVLVNGFNVFFPGKFNASSFLTAYIGIPIFLVLYLGHRFTYGRRDRWLRRPEEINLTDGLQAVEDESSHLPEKSEKKWKTILLSPFA